MSFGGMFGNHFHKGRQLVPFFESHDKLIQICDTVIRFFHDNAQPGDRLQFAVDRYGQDRFDELIRETFAKSEESAKKEASEPLELSDWKLRTDLQK